MKKLSVKFKITVWLTILTAVVATLLLVFMLSISNSVIFQTAMRQLSDTMHSNITKVSMNNGRLNLNEGFSFYQNGTTTLIYSKSEALLAGQLPVSFTAPEKFENGSTRMVTSGSEQYLVMDLWLPLGWDNGLWVRGLMEAPGQQSGTRNLIWVVIATLPVFILMGGLGGYLIVKKAFKPLDKISSAVTAINEAKDLKARIGLPEAGDEFTKLSSRFDSMFERLEQSFETEKQFTADASHELRTPLAVINSACEYAEKYDETPEERLETIVMIHRQAQGMTKLISQLLSMTRLEQGTELLNKEPFNISELVCHICTLQSPNMPLLEVEDDIIVEGDKGLLSRLLTNLLENAFKYSKNSGRVVVCVCANQGECQISVRDDGIGIPLDMQEKIWQRFYQVDPARSEGGAGLGLSMVSQIAKAHGGYMTLTSAPKLGSCFTLHLPINEDK